jgi:hypothetical protein
MVPMAARGIMQLRDQIRTAFPCLPFFGPIALCQCDECTEIKEGLREKQWDEIPAAFLDFTLNPTLLAPEAFQAFLPAYLNRALDDLDGEVLEFTVYSLSPNINAEVDHPFTPTPEEVRTTWLLGRVRLMSTAQMEAIRAFLSFIEENAADRDWFRPFITAALDRVWR